MTTDASSTPRFELRPDRVVADVMDALRASGATVWAVGGVVRDAVLDLTPVEWDLATSAHPDRVSAALAAVGPLDVDLALGRVAVHPATAREVVVTTLRRETGYAAGRRRPTHVEFVTDPAEDAARRDFTVNALYADPASGRILDPLGGLRDLRARTLRVIGSAADRLREDPLRILRAVRFVGRCDLDWDPAAERAVLDAAAHLGELSRERIFDELTAGLGGLGRERSLDELVRLGLARILLPDLAGRDAGAWRDAARVSASVAPGDAGQAWSAVLFGPRVETPLPGSALRTLGAPRSVRRRLEDVRSLSDAWSSGALASRSVRVELRRHRFVGGAIAFQRVRCATLGLDASRIETLAAELDSDVEPLLTGDDVTAAGVPQGPGVGAVLRAARAALDERESPTRAAALALVRRLAAQWIKDETGPCR